MVQAALSGRVQLQGLRPANAMRTRAAQVAMPRIGRRSLQTRCDGFFGSTQNVVMVVSTTLFLCAGRFGLAPTVNKRGQKNFTLEPADSAVSLKTGDPSGFTIVDVLAFGSLGHAFGVLVTAFLTNGLE